MDYFRKMNNKLKIIIKIFVSFLILYFLFIKINKKEFFGIIAKLNFKYLIFGLIFFLISYLINTKKWQFLLSKLKINESFGKLFKLNLISLFYTNVLPGGQITGEVIKGIKIAKGANEKEKLIFSILMDKITGLMGFIILGFFGIAFTESKIENFQSIFLIFLLSFMVIVFILLFFYFINFKSFIKKIPVTDNFLLKNFYKIFESFVLFGGRNTILLKSIIYSIFFQIFNTLVLFTVAHSLNLKIYYIDLIWIFSLVNIIVLLPITISGFGLREGSFIYFLGLLRISNAQAMSLSIAIFLVSFSLGLIGGMIEIKKLFYYKKNTYAR